MTWIIVEISSHDTTLGAISERRPTLRLLKQILQRKLLVRVMCPHCGRIWSPEGWPGLPGALRNADQGTAPAGPGSALDRLACARSGGWGALVAAGRSHEP